MTQTQESQRHVWALEGKLGAIANLVSALEIVSWQLAQASAEGEMAQLRDAVIGISYAMQREINADKLI